MTSRDEDIAIKLRLAGALLFFCALATWSALKPDRVTVIEKTPAVVENRR